MLVVYVGTGGEAAVGIVTRGYILYCQLLDYVRIRKNSFSKAVSKAAKACKKEGQKHADPIPAPPDLKAQWREEGVLDKSTSAAKLIPLSTAAKLLRTLGLTAAAAALEDPRYLTPTADAAIPPLPHMSEVHSTPAVAAAVAAQKQATAAAQAASKVVENLAPSGSDPGPTDPTIIPRWPSNLKKPHLTSKQRTTKFSLLAK